MRAKNASRQNSVNLNFRIKVHIGILARVLGVLFDILGVLFGVLGVLFGVLGVLLGIFDVLFEVLWEKNVCWLEKSTLPPVVAVVTNMRYDYILSLPLKFGFDRKN